MKITGYELFVVPPRWLFLKVTTDAGIVGWGEPILEGKAATVKTAVDELMEGLLGADPLQIEDHWNRMYRGGFYRGGPILMSALSGIDQALWDIKGKHHHAPIHQLMGGRAREQMKVYSWVRGNSPAEFAASTKDMIARGFTVVKLNACDALEYVDTHAAVEQGIRRVAAVREAAGPNVGIAVDFHGRVHKPMVKVLARELEPLRILFIEEAAMPENNEVLRELANSVAIPLATGERMYSRWQFKALLTEGCVDIIQPDLSHAGGITECKKIISMAEAFDVAAAPHCPLGPIALASCLQVDATCHNAFIQEQSLGIHYSNGSELLDYLVDPGIFHFESGYVTIPSGPGLGIEINEEHVRAMAKHGHAWRNPLWRHRDGSIAEW